MMNPGALYKWLKERYGTFPLFLFLLIPGILLSGAPIDPDYIFPLTKYFGIFLIFLAWVLCVLDWGQIIAYKIGLPHQDLSIAAPLGTVGGALTMMAMGHLHLLGPTFNPLTMVLASLGPLLKSYLTRQQNTGSLFSFKMENHWPVLFWMTPLLIFFGYSVALLNYNPDPMYYQLLAPRVWFNQGEIFFNPRFPYLFQAGYWEYLFLWANSWVGSSPFSKPQEGLIEVQLFCQWIHFFLGFMASALLINTLFIKRINSPIWRAGIIYAGLLTFCTAFTISVAKSDYGLLSWSIFSFLILAEETGPLTRNKLLTCGLILGMTLSNKIPTVFTIGPILGLYSILWIKKSGWKPALRDLSLLGVGILAGMAPLLIRNWIFTNNPFYPIFNSLFPSPYITPSMAEYLDMFKVQDALFSFNRIAANFKEFFHQNFIFIGFLFLIPFYKTFKNEDTPIKVLTLSLLIATVCFAILTKDNRKAWRVTGMPPIFWNCLCVYGIAKIFETKEHYFSLQDRKIISALFVSLMLIPEIGYYWFLTDLGMKNPSDRMMRGNATDSKQWIRQNAQADDLILTGSDAELYYVSHLNVRIINHDIEMDPVVFYEKSTKKVMKFLAETKVKYFIDDGIFFLPIGRTLAQIRPIIKAYPEAAVYIGQDSRVIDFQKLYQLALRDDRFKAKESAEGDLKPFFY